MFTYVTNNNNNKSSKLSVGSQIRLLDWLSIVVVRCVAFSSFSFYWEVFNWVVSIFDPNAFVCRTHKMRAKINIICFDTFTRSHCKWNEMNERACVRISHSSWMCIGCNAFCLQINFLLSFAKWWHLTSSQMKLFLRATDHTCMSIAWRGVAAGTMFSIEFHCIFLLYSEAHCMPMLLVPLQSIPSQSQMQENVLQT